MLITGWRIIRTASRLTIFVSLLRSELFAARPPTDCFETVGGRAANQAFVSEQRVDQNADDTGEKVAHDRQQTAEETAHVCLTSSCLVIGGAPKKGLEGACVVARQRRDRALLRTADTSVARLDRDTARRCSSKQLARHHPRPLHRHRKVLRRPLEPGWVNFWHRLVRGSLRFGIQPFRNGKGACVIRDRADPSTPTSWIEDRP